MPGTIWRSPCYHTGILYYTLGCNTAFRKDVFVHAGMYRCIDAGDDLEIAIPAFLTIVLMPFTYSITVGIGAGFLAYTAIKLVHRKASEVHPLMWIVAILFRLYFTLTPLTRLLT